MDTLANDVWRNNRKTNPNLLRKLVCKEHGISESEYLHLIRVQQGKCAICHRAGIPLSLDHDHRTGCNRGLICQRCNVKLIGLENKDWVSRALKYLTSYDNYGS